MVNLTYRLFNKWFITGLFLLSFITIGGVSNSTVHAQLEPCPEGSSQGAPQDCDTQFDIVPKNSTVCQRDPDAVLCSNENNEQGASGDNRLFGTSGVLTDITNIFALIVGVAAVIMIILGGFQYVTSAGDSNKINTAKNTILYALVGLVVVALARTIIIYVIGEVRKGTI